MKRIDDQTREEILELAEELEDDGWTVNRRAFAREFGVSPQSVSRILDGPDARRGSRQHQRSPGSHGGRIIVGVAIASVLLWLYRRGLGNQ